MLLAALAGGAAAIGVLTWVVPSRPVSPPTPIDTATRTPPEALTPTVAPAMPRNAPLAAEPVDKAPAQSDTSTAQLRIPTIADLPQRDDEPAGASVPVPNRDIEIPAELIDPAPAAEPVPASSGIDIRSVGWAAMEPAFGDPRLTESRDDTDWAARPGLRLSSQLCLLGGCDPVNNGAAPAVGSSVTTRDPSTGEARAELYDLSLNWRAFTAGAATLSLIGGVRSGTIWLQQSGDERFLTPTPVIGSGMAVKMNDWSQLRASAVTQLPGADNQIFELRVENVWRVAPASTLSLGYQHLRNVFDDQGLQPQIKRDAMVIEFRFAF